MRKGCGAAKGCFTQKDSEEGEGRRRAAAQLRVVFTQKDAEEGEDAEAAAKQVLKSKGTEIQLLLYFRTLRSRTNPPLIRTKTYNTSPHLKRRVIPLQRGTSGMERDRGRGFKGLLSSERLNTEGR
ncbi:hypothetical protein SAMN05444359_12526 [Neolewinella agarilytica]|uniref:Uncharacterized protein n=1 Tax=Neolewinella agarilytica TaxID=478744 RepID=A0A1H9LQ62_9BACT|nr:hypothetical protein SAMN05444359_12526 [Neolewinella agarilytica]